MANLLELNYFSQMYHPLMLEAEKNLPTKSMSPWHGPSSSSKEFFILSFILLQTTFPSNKAAFSSFLGELNKRYF